MEELVRFLVEKIVDHPQDVRLGKEKQEGGLIIKLSVHPEDMKVVIGKGGETIRALRDLLYVKASKQGKRVSLVLEEEELKK